MAERKHGGRVAIVSPNSARFVISLFGVSAFGRILVPINFRLNASEVEYIVGHSGAEVLLFDPELADDLVDVGARHRMLLDGVEDAELFAPTDELPSPWEPDEDATASINYTSDTTARPKGVQLTHRTLWLHAASIGWHLRVGTRDVFLQTQPLFHCNGWGLPYGLTAMGARQVMLRRMDGAEILRRVEEHGVTLTSGVPALLDAVLAANAARSEGPAPGRGTMRMFFGGAPPRTTILERGEAELGWELIHGYGLTESSPLLTVNTLTAEDHALPAPERARWLLRQAWLRSGSGSGSTTKVRYSSARTTSSPTTGTTPRATGLALEDGWQHTGDGGVLDESQLTITDRKKDVIISAFCRERLTHFKCPTSVELRDSLPHTATGKLQKFLLRAPYWEPAAETS